MRRAWRRIDRGAGRVRAPSPGPTPRPRPEQVTREEAERRILEQDEPYKLEILNRIKSDRITIWHTSKKQVLPHSKLHSK